MKGKAIISLILLIILLVQNVITAQSRDFVSTKKMILLK